MNPGPHQSRESILRLAAEFAATTIFWGVWLYVIMPLVSLLLWFAGVQVFVEQMITLGGYEAFLEKLTTYGLVVFVIMLSTFAWVTWNLRHYGRHNIRTHQFAPVTLAETADVAGLDTAAAEQLQRMPRMTLAFDAQNRLLPLVVETVRSDR